MPNFWIEHTEKEILANKPADQDIPLTCAVLSYEIGDAIKCAVNIHFGNVRGYQGEANKGIGDSITMLRLLCMQLGLNFWDCLDEGAIVYLEGKSIRETRCGKPTGK